MYNELYFKTHLRKLMVLINDNIKKEKKLCFLIMPQLHDLYLIKKKLAKLSKECNVTVKEK